MSYRYPPRLTSFFILLTLEGSQRGSLAEFATQLDIVRRWCQGLFRPQVPCTHNQHCPVANSASNTESTIHIGLLINYLRLEQSPIQVLAEINVAWLQWSCENWYFQVDKTLRPALLPVLVMYVLKNPILWLKTPMNETHFLMPVSSNWSLDDYHPTVMVVWASRLNRCTYIFVDMNITNIMHYKQQYPYTNTNKEKFGFPPVSCSFLSLPSPA